MSALAAVVWVIHSAKCVALDSRLRESRFASGVSWPRAGHAGLSKVHGYSASRASRFRYGRNGHWVCQGDKFVSTSQNPAVGGAGGFADGRFGADLIFCRFADRGRDQHVEMLRQRRKFRILCNAGERVRTTTERPNNGKPSTARLDHDRALSRGAFGRRRSRATGERDNERASRTAHQCATKTRRIGGLQPTRDTVLLLGLAQRRYAYRLCCCKPQPAATCERTPLVARVIAFSGATARHSRSGQDRQSRLTPSAKIDNAGATWAVVRRPSRMDAGAENSHNRAAAI